MADLVKHVRKNGAADDRTVDRSGTVDQFSGDSAISRLASQIVSVCRSGETTVESGLVSLPSERDLSVRLGMSRHAVRNALAYLLRQGVLCRPGGRGPLLLSATVPPVRPDTETELRCINFVFNWGLDRERLHWLRDEYLAGFTEVLEHQTCKTRYVIWQPESTDYQSMLWCHASPSQQACMVVGWRDSKMLNWMNEQAVPYVVQNYCLYDYHSLPPHHKVYVNKAGGAFEATRRLMELGHRRIGFVGPTPQPDRLWPEYEGYQAALHCAGLVPDPIDTVDLTTEIVEQSIEPCRQLLDRRERPTAVVSAAGAITAGLLETARILKLGVPQQLSIIGFDSDKTPAYPELSTIAVPRRSLARQAMELLLKAVEQPDLPPQTQVVECTLNYQNTVGPAPR